MNSFYKQEMISTDFKMLSNKVQAFCKDYYSSIILRVMAAFNGCLTFNGCIAVLGSQCSVLEHYEKSWSTS